MTFTISEFWLGLIAGLFSCPTILAIIAGIYIFFHNRNLAKAEKRVKGFADKVQADAKRINEKQMGAARNGQ